MISKLLWQFDMLIYRLFFWRWKRRLIGSRQLRVLFLKYLNSWEALYQEPCMGVGISGPPKFPWPEKED